jgi:hypothetical protein
VVRIVVSCARLLAFRAGTIAIRSIERFEKKWRNILNQRGQTIVMNYDYCYGSPLYFSFRLLILYTKVRFVSIKTKKKVFDLHNHNNLYIFDHKCKKILSIKNNSVYVITKYIVL